MSNKLEEYKKSLLIKAKVEYDNSITGGFYPKGVREGFDAAIALELPVKFNLWVMSVSTGSIGEHYICKDLATLLRPDTYKQNAGFTTKELYTYWINNIFKPE